MGRMTTAVALQKALQGQRGSVSDIGDFLVALANGDLEITAGRSGQAGVIDLYPATAAKGKVRFTANDNTGNTTTTITFAGRAAAATITVAPDTGAATEILNANGVTTSASTSVNISAYGTTLLSSTATGGLTQVLDGPVAGAVKYLFHTGASTGITVAASTANGAVTFSSTSGTPVTSFLSGAVGDFITLVGGSSIRWMVAAKGGAITV